VAIEAGQQLLHYRLIEKIGEGGMGVVWKATDTNLDREVAIKILPDAFAADAQRLARFEREAKLLATLNHPNIAAVYGLHDTGTSTGSVRFLAMELIPGEDLAQRGTRGRPRPRRGSSRPQARERSGHGGRGGQGPRLRTRQGHGVGSCVGGGSVALADDDLGRIGGRRATRYGRLHEP